LANANYFIGVSIDIKLADPQMVHVKLVVEAASLLMFLIWWQSKHVQKNRGAKAS
jgi:hypothetical protein